MCPEQSQRAGDPVTVYRSSRRDKIVVSGALADDGVKLYAAV